MRGVEVDNSISIYATPDFVHTKWDISHEQPLFDYEPRPNCKGSCNANPCGKADVMQQLWFDNVKMQLGSLPHMVFTMCQKEQGWLDDAMKVPSWDTEPRNMFYAKLFEPLDFGNNIHAHVEWDKAPKDTPELGGGDGWEPFKFSQCCTTLVIAPQI